MISDFAKWDRPAMLHLAFIALDAFKVQHARFPRPRNEQDALQFMELLKSINASSKSPIEYDEKVVKEVAYQAQGDLTAMS